MGAIIPILANHTRTTVRHRWEDVHPLVDHHEVSVVRCFEVLHMVVLGCLTAVDLL